MKISFVADSAISSVAKSAKKSTVLRRVTVRFIAREERAKLLPAIAEAEFSGEPNAVFYLRSEATLFLGLGESGQICAQTLRAAAGTAARFLKKIGHTEFGIELADRAQFAGAVTEGLVLGDYRFETFLPDKKPPLKRVIIRVPPEDLTVARRAGERGVTIAEATNLARDIGNQPGNLLFPESLARRAERLADEFGLKVTVLNERELRARKFGGIVAVGQGSARPPWLIVLEHRGRPKRGAPIALVGKAITFDTGGISIKSAASMEDMIFDKCGGMAVLGAMAAIAELKLPRNVIGILASAENMPSGAAYRPGDILPMYDGKFVEIVNTDAEGRLVLADAIAYARRDFHASAIIDLATLTGACGVALGEHAAGLWSNDEHLLHALQAAAERAGERVWPMPLYPEFDEQIKSEVALLKNSGGRLGGACTGAAFLKAFAEKTPWAHLDIAFLAHREKDRVDLGRGATGFGVRTLVELVENWE